MRSTKPSLLGYVTASAKLSEVASDFLHYEPFLWF